MSGRNRSEQSSLRSSRSQPSLSGGGLHARPDPAIRDFHEHSPSGKLPNRSASSTPMLPTASCIYINDRSNRVPVTTNQNYGVGVPISEGKLDRRKAPPSPSQLAGGKSVLPPTSNSAYGYFSKLRGHKTAYRPNPTCAETQYSEFMLKNKQPYSPRIRFTTHGMGDLPP
eukprot:TRINITY_DN19933_c0_g1_i1.p1 TRINITY_DN19933_c0_g1~~TRINITY_DN19933_c0_g1_i1.p1  ORF type:complete len:170 (-),score=4.55 TRINITY_DN19933_c0_g1_i1:545-1054(-)